MAGISKMTRLSYIVLQMFVFSFSDSQSCTVVNVNIYLRSINDIDDYKMVI